MAERDIAAKCTTPWATLSDDPGVAGEFRIREDVNPMFKPRTFSPFGDFRNPEVILLFLVFCVRPARDNLASVYLRLRIRSTISADGCRCS